MRKGEATREAIVGEALAQSVQLGLNGLTLGMLADRLKLSKSGLFAHFKSKEALQMAVLEAAVARFQARVIRPAFRHRDGEARLKAFFSGSLRWIRGENDLRGCPFLAIAQECANQKGPLRDRFIGSQNGWRDLVAATALVAVRNGEFKARVEPKQFAFEFMAINLAYNHALRLGQGSLGLTQAKKAFKELMSRSKA